LSHCCNSIVDKHFYNLCPGQPVGQIPGGAGRQNHFAGQCSAKVPFSLEFAQDAQKRFENFHYQLGGDHALYYNLNLSEVLPTAVSKPNDTYRPLEKKLDPDIGDKVSFTAKEGELTLNEYVVHPNHRVQAVVMIHKGKIVYETYPGMNPHDLHAWMSPGKTTVALVIAQLEAEGKIDMNKEVTLSIFLNSRVPTGTGSNDRCRQYGHSTSTGRNDGSHRGPNLHHRKVFQCRIWLT
jgi:hypothetical protein